MGKYVENDLTSRLFLQMTGDAIITWPMFQALQYMSKGRNSNIYFSYFAYEGTFSTTFAYGNPNRYGTSFLMISVISEN